MLHKALSSNDIGKITIIEILKLALTSKSPCRAYQYFCIAPQGHKYYLYV